MKAAAESDIAIKSVGDAASQNSSKMAQLSSALKIVAPIAAGAALAALQLTGNMGALGAVLPEVVTFAGALIAPFASVAAILVALTGPLMLITGLLGLLGGAFVLTAVKAFGMKKDGLGQAIAGLKTQFDSLRLALVGRFMPVFQFLIHSASSLLGYFSKLAKMPLAEAFKSLATTGVAGLTKFLEKIGHTIAKPIRLAFMLAFGGPGQGVDNALGKIWDQILAFFSKAPKGGQSIDSMVAAWFGRHDFTNTGMRWGMELAGGIVSALETGVKHMLMSRGGMMILGGAGLGALVSTFTPVGPLVGATIGAGIGATLNHYWPRIAKGAVSLWRTLKTDAVAAFHSITTALEHFLGPTTWHRLGEIAKNVWNTIKMVAVSAFHIIVSTGKMMWQLFDTLVIKSGAWKVVLGLVKGAIWLIVDVIAQVTGAVKTVIGWVVRLANFVNSQVVGAFNAVLGVVNSIIGGIKTAIGWAQSLVNAIGAQGGPNTHPNHTPGMGGKGGRLASGIMAPQIHIHYHGPVIGEREIDKTIHASVVRTLTKTGANAFVSNRGLRLQIGVR